MMLYLYPEEITKNFEFNDNYHEMYRKISIVKPKGYFNEKYSNYMKNSICLFERVVFTDEERISREEAIEKGLISENGDILVRDKSIEFLDDGTIIHYLNPDMKYEFLDNYEDYINKENSMSK